MYMLRCRFVIVVASWFQLLYFFFFQAEDGIRDATVTGVQTCALPISQSPTWICRLRIIAPGRFIGNGTFRMFVRSSGLKQRCGASGRCFKPKPAFLTE